MKNPLLPFLALVLLASCSQGPSADADTDVLVDLSLEVEKSLAPPVFVEGDETWTIEERMEHYDVPGVSVAVINDYKIEWSKAYGVMDKDSKTPVTKNTLFQAASISKPVTAYGALGLVEQEKIDPEEDINTYLQSWKLPENEFTQAKTVHLQNLLSHTAGVTVHGFLGYSPDLPVPTLVEVLNGTTPANSGAIYVDKEPEQSFRYSGGGYNIVQQAMIDIEGKPFPQIMDEQVLSALDMSNSTYSQPLPAEQLKYAATGYLPDGTMTKGKRHTYPEMAPAGLWTTAEDLAKFAINLQKGLKGESQVGLSKEMTAKMLAPYFEDFIGLGIFLQTKKDQVYFGHGGWNEGFSSEMTAHMDDGYGVVIMTNSNHPEFISELVRAVALAYDWEGYVPRYTRSEADVSTMTNIHGRYKVNANELLEVSSENGQLWAKNILDDEAIEVVPVGDGSFVRRNRNQVIKFEKKDESGVPEMVFYDDNNGELLFSIQRMEEGEKIPMEMLLEGNFDEALAGYQSLKDTNPEDRSTNEGDLNWMGYEFLNEGKMQEAHDLLKINMMLYPESSNVYDSYAEVCMKMGKTKLAIDNYEKSIELDPQNQNARDQIEIMKKQM